MPAEAVDVEHGQFVGRRLKDCPVVVDLHELSPIGRRATGRRDERWFERFAEMCQDLPDRHRIGDERDESDVATSPRHLDSELYPKFNDFTLFTEWFATEFFDMVSAALDEPLVRGK